MQLINKGDRIVNKDTFDNENIKLAALSEKDRKKNLELFDSSTDASSITKPDDVNSIILVDKNEDGSVKYTFDNIYKHKKLSEVAKNYYGEREGKNYTHKEAIDKFISDRTWKQANTFAIGKEYLYITGNAGTDQKARLAYLTREWDKLPNFYQAGGRGWVEGLAKNLGAAVVDPLNIVGGFVGGTLGKAAVKKIGAEALKTATKKKATKDILLSPQTLSEVAGHAAKSEITKSAGTIAAIDAVGFAAADIAAQTTEKEIGLRKKIDPYRTMLVSVGAAGTSFIATAGIGLATRKLKNWKAAKESDVLNETSPGLSKTIKEGAELTDEGLKTKLGMLNNATRLRANLADQYDFVKILQKSLLGVEGSAAGLKAAIESGKHAVDPVLMPYFQLRMAAAASTRAHEFIVQGVYMPPHAASSSASFTKGRSLGLQQILKPFDDTNQVNSFLMYVSAKRQRSLLKNDPKLENELPLTKKQIEEAIDYGEMSAEQWSRKYGTNLTRKGDYKKGIVDLKIFTDELLDYQVASGLLSREAADKILKVNEFFIPLWRKKPGIIKKIASKIFKDKDTLREQTEKLLKPTRPGAKKLARTKQEGEINLYDNLVSYVYQAINGSDRNRAKIALYEMINKAKKLKQIDKDAVANKTNYAIENKKAIGGNVKRKIEEAGFKLVGPKDTLPNLDIAVFSGTFKRESTNNYIDIVYKNGKQEAYEIASPEMIEVVASFGDDWTKIMPFNTFGFGPKGPFSWYARVASRAITYSPPFVAFNAIRDTLAGTVNSVFGIVNRKTGVGFVPGWSSATGMIKSIFANNKYRQAMISGLGYSSRADSEKLVSTTTRDMLKYGRASEVSAYAGSLRKISRMIGGGWRGWKEIVSRVEYATRMGEYNLAKAAGFSDVAAGFLGREVSTDFGMRGSSTFLRLLSRNTMFLNAGIQGLYRTGRLAFEGTAKDKLRVASAIGATIIAPEVYLYFKNRDIPEYQQLDERIRQLNYVIPTYTKGENGEDVFDGFIYIPKPYDLGVFANVTVGLIKGIKEKTPELGMRYALQSFTNIIPGIGFPTAINPAMELIFNRNFYTGSPVLGFYEQKTIDSLRYRPQTREIAKRIYNGLSNLRGIFTIGERKGDEPELPFNLDPIKIDYLLGAYATGIFQYPIDILNATLYEPSDEPGIFGLDPSYIQEKLGTTKEGLYIKKPKKRTDEADIIRRPWSIVTRRFHSEKVIKNSFFHKEWFRIQQRAKELGVLDITKLDNSREVNKKYLMTLDKIVTNIDNNDPLESDEVQAYRDLGLVWNAVIDMMTELRETRKTIEMLPDMDSAEKTEIINELLFSENMILHDFFNTIVEMDLDYILEDTMVLGRIKNVDTYGTRKD